MRKRYTLQKENICKRAGWIDIPPQLADRVMQGDEYAIQEVVILFKPMICKIARRKYILDNGVISYQVDPFVKGYMEGRLMEALVRFPYL